MGGIVKRQLEIGVDTCLLGFGGREYVESAVFDATTLPPHGPVGTSEVQTVSITGAPTGGDFTLTFRGDTTAAIAYNASLDDVRDALEALADVGVGNVQVTGTAGGPWAVHFINDLTAVDQPLMTKDATGLTGGTSPDVTVVETTKGSTTGFDPRILVGSATFPGTIITKNPADTSKVKEYEAAAGEAIFGVIDGIEEFLTNQATGHRDVAVYAGPGCVFDHTKIKNYGTYQSAFDTWAAANGNRVR